MGTSAVTPERFAKGMTFDEYVRYVGSAENLAREAFETRTRSLLPPILTRGIIRSVWLLKAAPSAGAGAAVQVPTQCVVSLIAFDASS